LLKLRTGTPYLLIEAIGSTGADQLVDNDLYSGLTTTGGTVGGVIQNGYVTTPLTLAGNVTTDYYGARLYLDNGMLEVVPEPGTWAMMLGGLAVLVFIQARRRRNS